MVFNHLQYPKPISRKAEKAALKRKRQAHIARVRLSVSIRDRRCRLCGDVFGVGEYTPEMHEIQSRAALRGRPGAAIFNLDICVESTEH